MTSTVVVPVRLDLTWSDAETTAAERSVLAPTVDFSRLPRRSLDGDLNPGRAPLGASLLREPLSAPDFVLEPGTHLHWHLPDSLRRIHHASSSAPSSQGVVAAAPNRWLVERMIGESVQRWLVESDFLGPPGRDLDGVSYPIVSDGQSLDVRSLGRALDEPEWEEAARLGGEYLERLTAFGNGEPTFSAFYPSCRTVFGFHDRDLEQRPAVTTRYTVLGWYADERDDPLWSRGDPSWLETKLGLDELNWTLGAEQEIDGPIRMLSYGTAVLRDRSPDEGNAFAMGMTASNALIEAVAQVADLSTPIDAVRQRLEAVLHANALQDRHVDTQARFQRARHRSGFLAVAGEKRFRLRFTGSESVADAAAVHEARATPISSALTVRVAHLNDARRAEQQAAAGVDDARRRLFDDWCRYQLVAYRPEAADGVEIAVDRLRHHLSTRSIPSVEAAEAACLDVQRRADALEAELRELVDGFNRSVSTPAGSAGAESPRLLELQELRGPSYWVPREPVMVVATNADRALAQLRDLGPLSCHLVDLDAWPPSPSTAARLLERVRGNVSFEESSAVSRSVGVADPLFFEWEITVADVDGISSSSHTGRSIVSTHAADELMISLIEQMTPTTVLAFLAHDGAVDSGSVVPERATEEMLDRMSVPGALNRFMDWCDRQLHEDGTADGVGDVFLAAALGILTQGPMVSFVFDGFSARLLGHEQAYQLPVMDPLALDDHDDLVGRVARATGASTSWSPRGHDLFTPIREGLLSVVGLRLVDSFGRCRTIVDRNSRTDAESPTGVRRIEGPNSESSPFFIASAMAWIGTEADAYLDTRVLQPTRMVSRWMAAGATELEASDAGDLSPICGWLVPDELDDSLAIYDAEGQPLGRVTDGAEWRTVPGSPPIHPASLAEPHLRRVVGWLLRRGQADLAAFHSYVVDALDRISPEDHRQHQALALLMGRPLAVVRLSVGLELLGPPAPDPSWDAFTRHVLDGTEPSTGGVDDRRFEIHVGDVGLVDDGMVGYWLEDETTGVFVDDAFHSAVGSTEPLLAGVTQPERQLTVLLDPTAALHLSCDVVPSVAMSLSHELFDDALQRLAIAFEVGPVLAPTDVVEVPLPDEPGMSWTWLEREAGNWVTSPGAAVGKLGSVPQFVRDQTLHEGWLRLSPSDETDPQAG